jgi:hypothetical protein
MQATYQNAFAGVARVGKLALEYKDTKKRKKRFCFKHTIPQRRAFDNNKKVCSKSLLLLSF